MRGKWTSDLQLSAFSTWNSLNLLSSYNDARTKDATLPTTDTCEHKTKRANFENFKDWIAESQNPKSKITRKYSNILYNAFCKVKYHYNLIEAVNSLLFTISSSSTMLCLQIEAVEFFWNILNIEIGMSVPKTAKFLIM